MEANMQIMEGTQRLVRVVLRDETGEVLAPERFFVYGGAQCPGRRAVAFAAQRGVDGWVLTVPGLDDGGVAWGYQVFAAEYATGIEWLILAGEIDVVARVAGAGGVVAELLQVDAVLDRETLQVDVALGDSTAGCFEAVRVAEVHATAALNAAVAADDSASAAAESVSTADAWRVAAQDAAADAKMAAEGAAEYETAAAASATAAAGSAAAAAASATAAAASASKAASAAADAATGNRLAAESASTALAARDVATAAAKETAQTKAEIEATAEKFTAAIPSAEAAARDMYDAHVRDWLLAKFGVEKYTYFRDRETNKIVIHTDQVPEADLALMRDIVENPVPQDAVVEQYNHTFEISWRDINKYAACTTVAEMKEVNPDYKNDLTSSGAWVYPIPSMVSGNGLFSEAANMKQFDADISHLTNINGMFYLSGLNGEIVIRNSIVTQATGVLAGSNAKADYTHVTLDLPNVTDITHICYHCYSYLKEVKGNLDKVQIANSAFFGRYATDYYSILDFLIPLPSLTDGSGMFNRQGLTKASVLLICDSIPTYTDGSTHNIQLGIHRDLQEDEEVLAAIERARAAGWTVSVQWNGHWVSLPEAATTYSLRRPAAPPVYAMLKRDPNGEFVDETNTRFMVDWCHELHSPDGAEPEALGYTLFDSLEAALTGWGLVEYEAEAALAEELKQ